MREIKFRAFDTDRKVMVHSVDLSAPRSEHAWLGLYDWPLMQFTGLKDKNGKEIYEGDIVRYVLIGSEEEEYIEEVHFVNGCFELDNCPLSIIDDNNGEVIGNIYEHPDKRPAR